MKKLIIFLIAAIVIAFASLNIAPQLYARHASEQYLKEGASNLSTGDIDKGIEKLRLAIHMTKDTPPLLRSKEIKDIPDILLTATRSHPESFDEISVFAGENNIEFPCSVKLGIFSSLLDGTYSLFLQKTTGAETTEKIKRIEENLAAASRLSAGCEVDGAEQAKFITYREAYEKLAGKPFVEPPISTTLVPPSPSPAAEPEAEAPPAPNKTSSLLDMPKSIISSISAFINSKLKKTPPPVAAEPPRAAEPQPQPAAAPPPAAQPPAPQPAAAPQPAQKLVARQPRPWHDGVKSDLAKIGLKAVKIESAGNRTLSLSVQTSSEGAKLVDEMKAIFEVVDNNLKANGMLDQILYLDLDILSGKGVRTAGWRVTLSDYRLYRMGEMSGKEFTKKMVRK